jgi:hypothetical protein
MMNKIKLWRKLSTNKKLIFAIPQVVEMIDMLEHQFSIITELKDQVEFEMEQKAIAREQRNKVTNSLHNLKLLLGEDE